MLNTHLLFKLKGDTIRRSYTCDYESLDVCGYVQENPTDVAAGWFRYTVGKVNQVVTPANVPGSDGSRGITGKGNTLFRGQIYICFDLKKLHICKRIFVRTNPYKAYILLKICWLFQWVKKAILKFPTDRLIYDFQHNQLDCWRSGFYEKHDIQVSRPSSMSRVLLLHGPSWWKRCVHKVSWACIKCHEILIR